MTSTKAAVRPAPRAQTLFTNDPRPPGTQVRQERASARVDERAHGACRVVAPRRGRRPSGLNIRAPAAATAAGRGPDARANVPCQRRSAVRVCGVQATACTTPQAQDAFRRARRATVREWRPGASQRTGRSRLLGGADRGRRTSLFRNKIRCYVSSSTVEASGTWKDCTTETITTNILLSLASVIANTSRCAGQRAPSSRSRTNPTPRPP